jgi:hypothetical protein
MPQLEYIRCQRGQVLMDANSSLDHVFFPDSGVVSVVAVYADGSIIEMATIGRRVARTCKPSSAPNVPRSGFSSRFRGAQQRCRARRSPGPWGRCHHSEVSCTLTSKPIPSARPPFHGLSRLFLSIRPSVHPRLPSRRIAIGYGPIKHTNAVISDSNPSPNQAVALAGSGEPAETDRGVAPNPSGRGAKPKSMPTFPIVTPCRFEPFQWLGGSCKRR